MTKIEIADDMMQVDAKVLAKALRMDTNDLKQGMRDGTITCRIERGEGKHAGKVCLTFFSADRRVRMTADEDAQRSHALRVYMQIMGKRARKIKSQSDPPHAGTEHLPKTKEPGPDRKPDQVDWKF